MKNNLLIFLLFPPLLSFSQGFSGVWEINPKSVPSGMSSFPVLPPSMHIESYNESLMIVNDKGKKEDQLNYFKITSSDKKSMSVKQIILDPSSNTYKSATCNFKLDGNTLKGEYKCDGCLQEKFTFEYSFQSVCCSNHSPEDCADSPEERDKLVKKGCTGFHQPRKH